MKSIFIIFSLILTSIVKSTKDCATPLECYLQAIDKLNQAKEQYEKATAEIEKIKVQCDAALAKAGDALITSQAANKTSTDASLLATQALATSKQTTDVSNNALSNSQNAVNVANAANNKGDSALGRTCWLGMVSHIVSPTCPALCGQGATCHGIQCVLISSPQTCFAMCCNF